MNKLVAILFLICFIFVFVNLSFAEEFGEDEYYEKDGCIYIVGNPTPEEKAEIKAYRQERNRIRTAQVFNEIEREHELKMLETTFLKS